ncbi:uncharacterized protein BO66DRAFT_438736 [Aspergillus aculeatinus CBS 121060]|uniref:Uncharacterized protein n=1 Tax=Aspergillus aculeatinus CBS 121060 TaxID=1448322 RepID=A0ACD1H8W1_9EURO|nr:hypothetical protein BO66DRAFT_438736 [Aspergillus aculeatinus CBS 121060]RAH70031.1 hypothetical protein BO66DRAFT_438736 [Aspergillus aculeatinus CBS 121060]
MPTSVYILIYIGDPLDFTKYRHTGLFFEHTTGAAGIFEFQTYDNYNPEQSRRLASTVQVAELPESISEASIRSVISRTPVKNGPTDADWNCQNWVGDVVIVCSLSRPGI